MRTMSALEQAEYEWLATLDALPPEYATRLAALKFIAWRELHAAEAASGESND